MDTDNTTKEDHVERSRFIQKIIQNTNHSFATHPINTRKISMSIVQFWDNLDKLPDDVKDCMETWKEVEKQGFSRLLFDSKRARDFIYKKLGLRYLQAYDKCYHPAMQSDYFRLCYIFVEGGCYIDADDMYSGEQIHDLFDDGRLKIQPLCYDIEANMMVPPPVFTKSGANAESWIFYFNNNPLIACCKHPIIEHALAQSTSSLERSNVNNLPEIQSTTGPGNLSKSIFNSITNNADLEHTLLILCNWENIAKSQWELSYRNDARNWRHSNCRSYQEQSSS